jgi:hypothetical protein
VAASCAENVVVCVGKKVPRQTRTMKKFVGKKKKYSTFQVSTGKNIFYFKNSCIFAAEI